MEHGMGAVRWAMNNKKKVNKSNSIEDDLSAKESKWAWNEEKKENFENSVM